MEEDAFVEKVLTDLHFAAKTAEGLRQTPKAFKQLIAYPQVARKLVSDPVFFAVLMCGDNWLVDAPDHQKLLRDESPRQVAVCGRGWGKSLVFSRKNLWLLFTKPNIESLIISSTQRQSMIMFDYCFSTINRNPLLREMVQRPGSTRTVIKLKAPLNGKLVALPCSPNKLRGYHPDWIFLDEASIIPSNMITSEIMMMLTKPNVALVMSGTPLAFDHIFRKAYLDTKRYSTHHYSSQASPLVSKTQLNEWQEMMTKEEWEREVEAVWVETKQTFFPMDLIAACIDPELDNPTSPNRYIDNIDSLDPNQLSRRRYYAGLDLGKQVDYSVLAVVELQDKQAVRLVHKRRFPLGTPYPEVVAYVVRAQQIFDFNGVYVDKTGIGDAIVDELNNIGLDDVNGVFFTDTEKENMLNYLKLLMEKKQLRLHGQDKQLLAEINEQQYEYIKPKTAQERIHLSFHHPRGRHDDQLFALALACYATKECYPNQTSAVLIRRNPTVDDNKYIMN
jgi:phage terminase large subunit-like protein